jgi:hypothetical protein
MASWGKELGVQPDVFSQDPKKVGISAVKIS